MNLSYSCPRCHSAELEGDDIRQPLYCPNCDTEISDSELSE